MTELSPVPEPSFAPRKDFEKKPISFFFISGLGGADNGIRPIKESLETVDIGVDVESIAWNSVLSPDPRTPNRWNKMADQAIEVLQQGRRLVFIAHSGGAAELAKVFDKLKKGKRNLLSAENLDNIEVIFIGPAGILGGRETIDRTIELQSSQLGLPGVEDSATVTAGIESLFIFPPRRQDEEQMNLTLREVFPDLTNIDDSIATMPFNLDDRHWKLIPEDLKSIIDTIDSSYFSFLDKPESREEIEKLLIQRAKLLNEAGTKAYDAVDPDELANWEPAKIAAISYLGMLPLIRKLLFKGVSRDMRKLEERGLRVHWIVPEFDLFVLLRDIQNRYNLPAEELSEKINIVLLERASHAGWATQPKQLADAVKQILSS